MQINLKTDFIDYYDAWFDLTSAQAVVIDRWAGSTYLDSKPDKHDQFRLLSSFFNETVIPHGTGRQLVNQNITDIVVYTEPWLHAGRGKHHITDPVEIIKYYPGILASKYIKTHNKYYVSYKYLHLGIYGIDLKVTSRTSWLNNTNTYEVEVLDVYVETRPNYINYRPIYAIDYVQDLETDIKYAIDLNHAPGCRGLGIKDYLSGQDIVKGIREYIYANNTSLVG